jgi:hypothetical protein
MTKLFFFFFENLARVRARVQNWDIRALFTDYTDGRTVRICKYVPLCPVHRETH